MSPRSHFPAPRPSTSHYFLTISRGDRIRQAAFRPWVLWTAGAIAPVVALGIVGASAYQMFRDDVLSAMLRRQTELQYAYEDRIAAMRAQLDRVTSRQLLDQDTLEGRVHELISRQAQIENRATIIAMLAVPILIQVYFNSGLAYLLNRLTGEAHCVAGPSALIGASNFFELAVAAAISLFGFTSGAALSTVVGVLIEVPVMLSVVAIVNRSKGWYERGASVRRVAAHALKPVSAKSS